MDCDVGVLAFGAGFSAEPRKSAEFFVTNVQSPLRMKGLNSHPIFQSGAPQPNDMSRLAISPGVSELGQFRTQAFVDRKFHPAFANSKAGGRRRDAAAPRLDPAHLQTCLPF